MDKIPVRGAKEESLVLHKLHDDICKCNRSTGEKHGVDKIPV